MSIPLCYKKYRPNKEYSLKSGFFLYTISQNRGIIYAPDELGFIMILGMKPPKGPMVPVTQEDIDKFVSIHDLDRSQIMVPIGTKKEIPKETLTGLKKVLEALNA